MTVRSLDDPAVKALARKILADGNDHMPGPDDFESLRVLEDAGLAEVAALLHPITATYALTEKGRRWLAETEAKDD